MAEQECMSTQQNEPFVAKKDVDFDSLLESSPLMDYSHPKIERLIENRAWKDLDEFHRIGAAYEFVRDEIAFGYNVNGDSVVASAVLEEGIGQCNTKTTLLMALLRALKVPCRMYEFTVTKKLQKGAIVGLAYFLTPRNLLHTSVEVLHKDSWVNLEGVILDKIYLEAVQQLNPDSKGQFCGFAVAAKSLHDAPIDWRGRNTCIQTEAITADLGIFDSPDEFHKKYGTNLSGIKKAIYSRVFAPRMNATVERLRALHDLGVPKKSFSTPAAPKNVGKAGHESVS